MLPPNVLRPTAEDWQDAWGGRDAPARYAGLALEIGERLALDQIGACIRALPPGGLAGPLHHHHLEEELFYVLQGELTARELPAGADRYVEYPLRAGEIVVYPPGTGLAHRSHNESGAEVRYLCLSSAREPHEIAEYPDSGKILIRGLGFVGVFGDVEASLTAARAAAAARGTDRLAASERPGRVQGPDTLPERALGVGISGRPLARSAGATRVFANRDRLAPGAISGPLHWHTADEELLLVLEGAPTLRQVRDGREERALLQPGDAVAWKASDRVAHQLVNEGEADAVVLVVGTSRQDDAVVLPESDTVHVRALGCTGTLRVADYWAGEP